MYIQISSDLVLHPIPNLFILHIDMLAEFSDLPTLHKLSNSASPTLFEAEETSPDCSSSSFRSLLLN